MKNIAIIPAKSNSRRLPNKNIRSFLGRPMVEYTLEAAKKSELFDNIHVSTESEDVAGLCAEIGFPVDFLRPQELATDEAKLNDVCAYVLKTYSQQGVHFDNFCILWATAPMRTAEDIISAYNMLEEKVDGVVGVTEYNLPVYCAQNIDRQNNLAAVFPEMLLLSSSEMPKVVCDNGSLCWVRMKAYETFGNWLLPSLKGYYMPRNKSVDIDTQEDWEWAEFLCSRQSKKSSSPG